ncbi:MAG: DUF2909 domain-containing protein [Gammaproteobacteria bacterium]|nr:MAG: DUF2909 domain-containing protein [Gammaproteobacteria bacterium]
MWLKPTIVVLFVLLVIALVSGGAFLIKDEGAKDKKRILWSLGIRVSLAVALLAVVAYGIFTGQLRSHAPWSRSMPVATTPVDPPAPTGADSAKPASQP